MWTILHRRRNHHNHHHRNSKNSAMILDSNGHNPTGRGPLAKYRV
jgi:hypothetical protein